MLEVAEEAVAYDRIVDGVEGDLVDVVEGVAVACAMVDAFELLTVYNSDEGSGVAGGCVRVIVSILADTSTVSFVRPAVNVRTN